MFFYNIAIRTRTQTQTPLFTYSYHSELPIGSLVFVDFRRKKEIGIIIDNVYKKPSFTIKDILLVMPITYPLWIIDIIKNIQSVYNSSFHTLIHTLIPEMPKSLIKKDSNEAIVNKKNEDIIIKNNKKIQSKDKPIFLFNSYNKKDIYSYYLRIIQNNKKAPVIIATPYIKEAEKIYEYLSKNNIKSALYYQTLSKTKKYEIIKNVASEKIRVLIGNRNVCIMPFSSQPILILDQYLSPDYQSYDQKPLLDFRIIAEYMRSYIPVYASTYYTSPSLIYLNKKKKISLINPVRIPRVALVSMTNEQYSQSHPYISEKIIESIRRARRAAIILNNKGVTTTFKCKDCKKTFIENIDRCPVCNGSSIKKVSFDIKDLEKTLKSIFPSKKIKILTKDTKSIAHEDEKNTIIIATSALIYAIDSCFDCIALINTDLLIQKEKHNTYDVLCDNINRLSNYTNEFFIQIRNDESPLKSIYTTSIYPEYAKKDIHERILFKYPPCVYETVFYSETPFETESDQKIFKKSSKKDKTLYIDSKKFDSVEDIKLFTEKLRIKKNDFDVHINPEFDYIKPKQDIYNKKTS